MRWQGRRQSSNVEDMRSSGSRAMRIGGGLSGIGILIALGYMLLGGNPSDIANVLQNGQSYSVDQDHVLTENEKEMGEFISTVLADIEDV